MCCKKKNGSHMLPRLKVISTMYPGKETKLFLGRTIIMKQLIPTHSAIGTVWTGSEQKIKIIYIFFMLNLRAIKVQDTMCSGKKSKLFNR